LAIKITTAGALTRSLPNGKINIKGENLTVEQVLRALVNQYGQLMADELIRDQHLKEGLCLLVNGRNVLSLPDKFETLLKDGDELIITTMLAGG
jgi:molybdopterin converting factor small subunit